MWKIRNNELNSWWNIYIIWVRKPFVVQRKVFQTSGSYVGAAITTKLFSIIQTAVINNINVEKYLNYVFENINKEPIENLLPYSENILKKLR